MSFQVINDLKPFNEPIVVVLGNFDGIHCGHIKLIQQAKEMSVLKNAKSAIITFEPHPRIVLEHKDFRLINNYLEKEILVERLGVDYLIQYPFNKDVASLSPEAFMADLMNRFQIVGIVVGTDYRFGHKQAGTTDTLAQMAVKYKYHLMVVEKELFQDREISSTWIREAIIEGNITLANQLLGGPVMFFGTVVKGMQIGRGLGFPTVNMMTDPHKVLPPTGIYASTIEVDGVSYFAATNIGYRPTFEGKNLLVETFILDFEADVYGKDVVLFLHKFLRPEYRFDSLNALKEQIAQDVIDVRKHFNI